MSRALTPAEYEKRVAALYPTLTVMEPYVRAMVPILHKCNVCSCEWRPKPNAVLSMNSGCPKCGLIKAAENRKRGYTYDDRLAARHNGTIIRLGPYVTIDTKTKHQCLTCEHVWFPVPGNLVRVSGCPQCQNPQNHRYSHSALQWLTYEENRRGIVIQHAGRGREFVPPGTKYRVDGYHADTNTIFEYYGDAVHGNLFVYAPYDTPSWWHKKKTAFELYTETLYREACLKLMGYNLVSMWERDWKKIHKYEAAELHA